MKQEIRNRLKRTAVLAIIALLIGAGVGYYQVVTEHAQSGAEGIEPAAGVMNVTGMQVGGPYSLVNQDGQTVTEKTYDGSYKLVFFGFTFCPEICPTALQKISKIMEGLEGNAAQVQPLFISVDPERDTPEVMKEYVAQFDPRIVGLTGSTEQIEKMEQNYHVYATKFQDETMGDYMMNHSGFTYLMGPHDEFLGLYRSEDEAADIIEDIRKKLPQS